MLPGLVGTGFFGSALAAGGTNTDGALAYRSASAATTAALVAQPFANEAYDRSGYHDNVTNNTRLTIPSGVSLVRLAGTTALTASNFPTSIRKGGASFAGSPLRHITTGTGYAANVKTGPLAVSAADYFELWRENTLSQTFNADYNFLAVEVLSPSLSYAFVNKTGTQSIASGAATALTWDNDVVNVGGGWHSTVTNNSRLTVPVGVTRVRVTTANQNNASTTGSFYLATRKNGAYGSHGLAQQTTAGSAFKGLSLATAILPVTGGTDYFESVCAHFHSGAASFGSDRCWAAIEDCSSTVACLVKRSGNQAISANTWTVVQWDAEEFKDVTGMHDNSTNPNRLIVPAGYTQARVSFNLETTATDMGGLVGMNGANHPGCAMDWNNGVASGLANGLGAWIDVTPGDYFEVSVYANSATNVTSSTFNWACLEVR